MKTAVPLIRTAFLVLFFVLLKTGFLMAWLIMYLLSLLLPLLFGKRLYCMMACPMNTLISWVLKLKQKMNLKNRPAPKWLSGGKMVWISLPLTVAVFIISRKAIGKDLPMMVVWMVIAVGMTLGYHPDVFHDELCPFGVAQGTLAKTSLMNEENRKITRDYKGFTASVLGSAPKNKTGQA